MPSFGDQFRLTLLTNDPVLARSADLSGINRVGIDLERLGKAERQAGHNVRFSEHVVEDLAAIADSLVSTELFVRLNPLNPNTPHEVEAVLRGGARVLMLPFFRTPDEVNTFVRLVSGRAFVMILVETASAVARIREILRVPGIAEVMIGLNDLRLEMGVGSHFELLASPMLDAIASEVRDASLPFSVGGVALPGDQAVPIPPDLVLAQYPRLGATGAWVSRSLLKSVSPDEGLREAVASIRRRLTEWAFAPAEALERARDDLAKCARERRSIAAQPCSAGAKGGAEKRAG